MLGLPSSSTLFAESLSVLTTKQTLFVSLTQEQVWRENSIDPTHPTKDRRKAKVRGKFKLPKSKFGNGETIENVIETL